MTIIYTPNLEMNGYPADRLIAVDLENGVTRVFDSDYFGECKRVASGCGPRLSTAGGLARHAGKFSQVRGTNRFFPLKHAQQSNRFWELLESSPMEVYLMNTGRVGGDAIKASGRNPQHSLRQP